MKLNFEQRRQCLTLQPSQPHWYLAFLLITITNSCESEKIMHKGILRPPSPQPSPSSTCESGAVNADLALTRASPTRRKAPVNPAVPPCPPPRDRPTHALLALFIKHGTATVQASSAEGGTAVAQLRGAENEVKDPVPDPARQLRLRHPKELATAIATFKAGGIDRFDLDGPGFNAAHLDILPATLKQLRVHVGSGSRITSADITQLKAMRPLLQVQAVGIDETLQALMREHLPMPSAEREGTPSIADFSSASGLNSGDLAQILDFGRKHLGRML